eukprot:CAMPEP_0202914652 /NCGR_PEP_ID=MMETSP1392-20130828/63634_1 /ASSEMBLY_ACC=CAM_ASM_000868 /TAXON_ID=225041 /ORGANISM="Chlamydomonas chlamydogama, Strain SAG 11-48b" /LENGTH=60 /DNA_ID=CAMNT_0049606383 /DNA_START=210 /DNA_END=392 /DNA_ORIENTATION=+
MACCESTPTTSGHSRGCAGIRTEKAAVISMEAEQSNPANIFSGAGLSYDLRACHPSSTAP